MPHLHLSPHPMDPSSAQTLLESPKTLAQKSGFIVRCYRRSDDLDRIRNMFVQSTLHGRMSNFPHSCDLRTDVSFSFIK